MIEPILIDLSDYMKGIKKQTIYPGFWKSCTVSNLTATRIYQIFYKSEDKLEFVFEQGVGGKPPRIWRHEFPNPNGLYIHNYLGGKMIYCKFDEFFDMVIRKPHPTREWWLFNLDVLSKSQC